MLNSVPATIVLSIAIFSVAGCASQRTTKVTASSTSASSPSSSGLAGEAGGLNVGRTPELAPYSELSEAAAVSEAELNTFASVVGDQVYFALDSYALDAGAQTVLDRQARWLNAHPQLRALVAGHADERGTREYNLALGSRRASAARDFLVARGVAAHRLETVSYGKERPLDSRGSEEGWARNRNAHSGLRPARRVA